MYTLRVAMALSTTPRPLRVALRPALPADAGLRFRWRGEPSVRRHQPLSDASIADLRADLVRHRHDELYRGRGERFQWIVLVEGEAATARHVDVTESQVGGPADGAERQLRDGPVVAREDEVDTTEEPSDQRPGRAAERPDRLRQVHGRGRRARRGGELGQVDEGRLERLRRPTEAQVSPAHPEDEVVAVERPQEAEVLARDAAAADTGRARIS